MSFHYFPLILKSAHENLPPGEYLLKLTLKNTTREVIFLGDERKIGIIVHTSGICFIEINEANLEISLCRRQQRRRRGSLSNADYLKRMSTGDGTELNYFSVCENRTRIKASNYLELVQECKWIFRLEQQIGSHSGARSFPHFRILFAETSNSFYPRGALCGILGVVLKSISHWRELFSSFSTSHSRRESE